MEFYAYYNQYLAIRKALERSAINPVSDVAGSTFTLIAAPALIYEGSYIYLFNEGAAGHAYEDMGLVYSDDDGVSWQWHPNGDPLVRPAMGGWSANGDFAAPDPIIVNGQRYMFYTSKSEPDTWKVGVATTDDWVTSYTNDAGNPVLDKGEDGTWDDICVYHTSIIRVGDTFYMLYTGQSEPGYVHPAIGLATTSAASFPTGWSKHADNPLIDFAERPRVIKVGDFYYILYRKTGGVCWLAYSDDLIDWIEVGPVSADIQLFEADILKVNSDYILAGRSTHWNAVRELGIFDPAVEVDEVDLNGHCRTDFGDVRFAASDLTKLYYHMDEKIDGFFAKFIAKIPSIPIGPNEETIYVYYGKASETEESDPDNTYDFYDDFETDLSKWTVWEGGGTVGLVTTPAPPEGSKSVEMDDTSAVEYTRMTVYFALRDYRVSFYVRTNIKDANSRLNFHLLMGPDAYSPWLNMGNENIRYRSAAWTNLLEYWANVWYPVEITTDRAAHTFDMRIHGSEWSNLAMHNTAQSVCGFYRTTEIADINKAYLDIHKVRKYIDPEPAHKTWGSEEAVAWPW